MCFVRAVRVFVANGASCPQKRRVHGCQKAGPYDTVNGLGLQPAKHQQSDLDCSAAASPYNIHPVSMSPTTNPKGQALKLQENLDRLRKENQTLKRSLAASQKMVASLPSGALLIRQGKILYANEYSLNRLGYVADELLETNFLDLVHVDSQDTAKRLLRGWPVKGIQPGQEEIFLVSKGGDMLPSHLLTRTLRHEGKTTILANWLDLQAWKEGERQSHRADKLEAISRLAKGISREVRQLLDGLDLPPHQKEKGSALLRCLESLCPQGADPGFAPVDLKKVVQQTMERARIDADQKTQAGRPRVLLKTYMRHVSSVMGDPGAIQEALTGVIGNALEALPAGGNIFLTTEENGGFAEIYVQDNGKGIPRPIQEKVFDPYFTTKGRPQAGLGLSVAEAIIRRHRGQMDVMSLEGQGTTITIRLPIADQAVITEAKKGGRPKCKEARFLIITEGDITAELLSHLIERKGGIPTLVPTPAEALKLLKKHRYDLLLAYLPAPDPRPFHPVMMYARKLAKGPRIAIVPFQPSQVTGPWVARWKPNLVISKPLHMERVSDLLCHAIVGHGPHS
jgi:PAS domain S-box-containing protein